MKLAVAITFFYAPERLKYLRKIASRYVDIQAEVEIYLITNEPDLGCQKLIREALSHSNIHFVVPNLLGHPFLLTWIHREVFKRIYFEDSSYSHFLYVEDDLEFSSDNFKYWLKARDNLRQFELVPSFLRYEVGDDGLHYSTDVTQKCLLNELPHINTGNGYFYVNLRQPYQGMYLMDRDLMGEFISSPAFSPDFGKWNIREKAAQGLTFYKVPKNCFSRNFVGYSLESGVDTDALIHHLPDNYANNPDSKFGKLRLIDVLG